MLCRHSSVLSRALLLAGSVLVLVTTAAATVDRSGARQLPHAEAFTTVSTKAEATALPPEPVQNPTPTPTPTPAPACARTVKANVVAINQVITYNRFGSMDPSGMIFALRRDVTSNTSGPNALSGTEPTGTGITPASESTTFSTSPSPTTTTTVEPSSEASTAEPTAETSATEPAPEESAIAPAPAPGAETQATGSGSGGGDLSPGNARLRPNKRPRPIVLRVNEGDCLEVSFTNLINPNENDRPATPTASFHVNGLDYLGTIQSDGAFVGKNPSSLAAPGQTRIYKWYAAKQGQYFAFSQGATSGGEGDGGQVVHGLFGAVIVEPRNSVWYRSQVTAREMQTATKKRPNGRPLTTAQGHPVIDFDARDPNRNNAPLLAILDPATNEIVHSDINAVITTKDPSGRLSEDCTKAPPSGTCGQPFREFVVMFHDEVEDDAPAFSELLFEPFLSVKDGFGVNYGVAGFGSILFAQRKKVGPAKNCVECNYEEFFLDSWPNGDPATIIQRSSVSGSEPTVPFPDDPSNVHHSYLNDPVRMRNIHAGPKETHVFHLHAHQWLQSPRDENSTYLDAQTVAPGAAFTYEINFGGSGNRVLTPGDSIFHCHLYPHFAQGMWELWRVHDVFEAGTPDRNLPDGEITAGIPQPAVVPIPNLFYRERTAQGQTVNKARAGLPPMPRPDFKGYPFYIPARAGHRPPQPPLALEQNGGLPRHRIETGVALHGEEAVPPERRADPVAARVHDLAQEGYKPWTFFFAHKLVKAQMTFLPDTGTPEETRAMTFHAGNDATNGASAPFKTEYDWQGRAYPSAAPDGSPAVFVVNGRPQQPGAPYADPCPDSFTDSNNVTRPTFFRRYRAAWIQLDLEVNKARWHDRQGRITVLEEDVAPTRAGLRPTEPFFFRSNTGDCVDYRVTNLIPAALNLDDFQLYQGTDIVGQHIHLVQFDVTASDGAANGWNYESGAFSPETVRERIEANNTHQRATGGTRILTPQANPAFGPGTNQEFLGAQTLIERWWTDPLINNQNRDRTKRTTFTHDHFSPSGHQHHGLYGALVVEQTDSVWTTQEGIPMNTRPDGGPTSYAARIISGPSGADSFREFNLALADFAILYTQNLVPVNPPNREEKDLPIAIGNPELFDPTQVPKPEAISSADPGTQLINYRNEPVPHRIGMPDPNYPGGKVPRFVQRPGAAGDMAFVFSSAVHGDPATPILGAYPGDRVQVKLIQGAQEEQHVFNVHGQKWLFEPGTPNDPTMVNNSGFTNSQHVGIAEHFEFELNERVNLSTGTKDYLYSSAATDNLWDGQWGILRSFSVQQSAIQPLPNNLSLGAGLPVNPLSSGLCPVGAGAPPIKTFAVQAVLATTLDPRGIVYSERFKHKDPAGIVFVETKDIPAIQAKTKKLEPLVLRVNAGDCVEVTLTNSLPVDVPEYDSWNMMPPIQPGFNFNQVRTSNRVSMHPQLLTYDVGNSDGATIGFNPDQTVGPGESRVYAWYAGSLQTGTVPGNSVLTPVEYGVTHLRDYGDVIKHASHGLIGTLIVEPINSTHTTDAGTNASATVFGASGQVLFREHVLLYQHDVTMQDEFGEPMENFAGEDDPEDTGQKAFNYKHEPLWARLDLPPDVDLDTLNRQDFTNTLSSTAPNPGCGGACGDPETPVFTTKVGTPTRFRVVDVAGHPRQHGFTLFGHNWEYEPWTANSTALGSNPFTFVVGSQSAFGPTRHFNILTQAGGIQRVTGDYLYRTQESFQFTSGLWGLFRVIP